MELIDVFQFLKGHIELLVTVVIGILGWIWGIIQTRRLHRTEKQNLIAERRYQAYNTFILAITSFNEEMRKDPTKRMVEHFTTFLKRVYSNPDNVEQASLDITLEMLKYMEDATRPLASISVEIDKLQLVASDSLWKKLQEMKEIALDLNNECQSILKSISPKDNAEVQKKLNSIGQLERMKILTALSQEIIKEMKIEIALK